MKHARAAVAIAVLAAAAGTLLPTGAPGDDALRSAGTPHAQPLPAGAHSADELIVVFRDGTDEAAMERTLRAGGAAGGRRSRFGARVLARLEPGASVSEAAARFAGLPGVAWAEPNGLIWVDQAVTFAPNDTFYRYQWNLRQVNAERTWGIQKGKSTVAVAVLDTGVAYEDYADPRSGQQFRKAPDWGDTRFLPGYDFFNDDAHPNDDRDHGTHVASTISEGTNNGLGVAGLAFGCAIMPVKVLGANGVGTFFALADAIDYAIGYTENGQRPVKVINLSLSSSSFNQTVKSALDRAAAAGVLVVASAGNNGAGSVNFPADQESVVAVGALNAARQKAWYSNTGPELDFVAPGGDCERDDDADGSPDCVFQQTMRRSSAQAGRYDDFSYFGFQGTSMAAPHVSAAAALLFSQGFSDATAVRKALELTAERLGGAAAGGRNDSFGHGLIQPAAALVGYGLNVGTRP